MFLKKKPFGGPHVGVHFAGNRRSLVFVEEERDGESLIPLNDLRFGRCAIPLYRKQMEFRYNNIRDSLFKISAENIHDLASKGL
jgi:hypothetical protein